MRTTEKKACPHCGFNEEVHQRMSYQLAIKTVLNGRYLIGRVYAEDENWIIYLTWDQKENKKVLVYEYFPRCYVIRSDVSKNRIIAYRNEDQAFEDAKKRWEQKSEKLKTLYGLENVILPKQVFRENNTVYVVIPYVQMQSLEQYWQKNPERMDEKRFIRMADPMMRSLGKIHAAGLVHTAVTPSVIGFAETKKDYCFRANKIQLEKIKEKQREKRLILDGFLSADNPVTEKNRNYYPLEKYWGTEYCSEETDWYEMCAFIYRALTGCEPEAAPKRLEGTALKTLSEYKIAQTLMNGMELFRKDRYISEEQLFDREPENIRKQNDKNAAVKMAAEVLIKAAEMQKDKAESSDAVRTVKRTASARTLYERANKYYFGNGSTAIRIDREKAFTLYQQAAEAGHADAQCCLGVCYYCGEGTKRDEAKARLWTRKAAEQGHKTARTNLYLWYRNALDPLQEKSFEMSSEKLARIKKKCQEYQAVTGQRIGDMNSGLIKKLNLVGEEIFFGWTDPKQRSREYVGFVITNKRIVSRGLSVQASLLALNTNTITSYEALAKCTEWQHGIQGVQANHQVIATSSTVSMTVEFIKLFKEIQEILLRP